MTSPAVNAALRGRPDWFPGASFGADFTRGRYKLGKKQYRATTSIPGFTFARTSTGTAKTEAGSVVVFDSGAPRITDKGLLVEESRTQYVRNANGIGGSGSVMPTNWSLSAGGLSSLTIVGYGTDDNGHSYVDIRAQGTPSASASGALIVFDTSTGVPAAEGEVWTASADISIIAGSTSGITSVALYGIQRTAAAASIAGLSGSDIKASLTSTPQRFTATFSALAATTAYFQPFIRIVPVSGATIDMTLRIKYPQWEKGTFATSYIPTTTASATRAADIPTINPFTPNYAAGTLFVQATPGNHTPVTANYVAELWSFSGGTSNNVNVNRQTSSQVRAQVYNNGGARFNSITTAWANATRAKVAISYKPADYRVSMDGGTVQTASTAGDPIWDGPNYPDALGIGHAASSGQFNGYIEKAIYYPRAFSSAELQAATTPDYVGPSVQLEFNTSRYVLNGTMTADVTALSGWTFSRTSTGYAETVAGTLTSFASGAPRITDKGLLVEESRTNLLVRSQEFDNASWTKQRSNATANAVIAPDGTLTADKFYDDNTAAATHELRCTSVTKAASAITYTGTVYAKAGERSWLRLMLADSAGSTNRGEAFFQLSGAGAIGTTASSGTFTYVSSRITALADSWYRCEIVVTSDTGTAVFLNFGLATGNNGQSYSGDGASGLYLWGAQLEAGAFATSYIPTTTASATRAVDVARLTGLSVPSAGTIYMKAKMPLGVSTDGRVVLNDGTNSNVKRFFANSTTLYAQVTTAGSSVDAKGTALAANAAFKASVGHDGTNAVGAINGVSGTAAVAAPPTLDQLDFGAIAGSGIRLWNNYIEQFVIYPTCLTAATQAALTT